METPAPTKPVCFICKKAIEPAVKSVEMIGGFFLKEDPLFFVVDEGVLQPTRVHLECLVRKLRS
jgi:hypothetical protein